MYHKAVVDGRGRPTAWLQRSVFQPIASTFDDSAQHGMPDELELGLVDLPYDVPNLRMENGAAEAHVRIGWFRAVTNNYHVFAAQCFADEMAHAAGRDPLEFLLDLLGPGKILDLKALGVEYPNYGAPYDKFPYDTRRLRSVLEVAAEKAGWGKRKTGGGCGMGIAAHRSFNTYVASVVEVEVDGKGQVRVPRIDQVAGCRRHREPGPRARADRGRGGDGRGPGAHRRDHGRQRPHRAEQLQPLPGGAHERRALPGERAPRRQRARARRAWASRACRP